MRSLRTMESTLTGSDGAEIVLSGSIIRDVLRGWHLPTSKETFLQQAVEKVLAESMVPVKRDVVLRTGRIYFLAGSVGIECKITGSTNEVLRQLIGNAGDDIVSELLLVTSQAKHRSLDSQLLLGKRVSVYWIKPW